MAQKRMISISVVESYNFLTMPLSAQALYMHLLVNADDDGVVEAYKVMLMVQAKPDDLHILVVKKYVTWLDENRMIIFLNDWLLQNTIRADRYRPSIYQKLLLNLFPSALREQKNRMYSINEQCQSFGTDKNADVEQTRIEQISIEETRTEQVSVGTTTESRVTNYISEDLCQEFNIIAKYCKMLGVSPATASSLIVHHGYDAVLRQLQNLERAKNVKKPDAWLHIALKNNFTDHKSIVSASK